MRLTDSASMFSAEVWAIIKALEQIKDSFASKSIIFTDSPLCLQPLGYINCSRQHHPSIPTILLAQGKPTPGYYERIQQ